MRWGPAELLGWGPEAPALAPAGNWSEIQMLGLTLDLLNQKLWGGDQALQVISSTLRLYSRI